MKSKKKLNKSYESQMTEIGSLQRRLKRKLDASSNKTKEKKTDQTEKPNTRFAITQ